MTFVRTFAVAVGMLLAVAAPAFAGSIEGTDLGDFITGTPGDDQVLAKGGDDTVYGLPGNDRIQGDGMCPVGAVRPAECTDDDDRSGADDVLRGGDGDDIVLGGRGN